MALGELDFIRRTNRKRFTLVLFCAAGSVACLSGSAHAQSSSVPAPTSSTAVALAPVVVTGILPGPALWEVSKGSHVMWVLGLTSPVPKNMQWKSVDVESRIAASQAVLKLPSLKIGVPTSFYRDSMMASDNSFLPPPQEFATNPDHQTLRDVLTPELYRRWLAQKARYLKGDSRVEHLRPILAGHNLYEAALNHYGLVDDYGVENIVYKIAAHDRITTVGTSYHLLLKDPHDAIRALSETSLNDQRCLGDVMDALDHDLVQATVRANAWATGDIDTLRSIMSHAQEDSCLSTLDSSQFARALGITDIEGRVRKSWIDSAEHAIDKNQRTFAVLPMHELLAPDGYLSVLRADGYSVQAPGE